MTKLKTKCFQMPLIIDASLDESARHKILSRLIDCGFVRTAEQLNRHMWKKDK
jgi:hypothetical protein